MPLGHKVIHPISVGLLETLTVGGLEQVIQRSGFPQHWFDRQHEDPSDDELLQEGLNLLRQKDGLV